MSDIWTDKPAEYWYKRATLAENYTEAAMTIIGRALPHIQNDIISLDNSWNEQIDKLDTDYPSTPEDT